MWYRVVKLFEHTLPRKAVVQMAPGQLVDILQKQVADRLLKQGVIAPMHYSFEDAARNGVPADEAAVTKRVGIWLSTSAQYSGGRIHMFQYGVCLARAGAEVYLVTNGHPRWAADYDVPKRLTILNEKSDPIPPDIDLVVTDSKTELGRKALAWARRFGVPLVCMNFETPNWVKEYCQEYARRLNAPTVYQIFGKADLLLANSAESLKWCVDLLGKKPRHSAALPPAVNTDALAKNMATQVPDRPYAFWCARGAAYKGSDVAWEAVWALDQPFDIVGFGHPSKTLPDTDKHRYHSRKGASDAEKFALLRKAHMCLAPSLFEGFGMVPFEALAAGTPCVVYDLPVLRQNYGDRLIYVEWKNRDAFKRRVREIAGAPRASVEDSQKWAVKTYGLQAMAKRIEALPYHAIKRPSVTAHMICYGTPTAVAAVEAVYPHCDQIIIAYGPTKQWDGWADNGVLEQLRQMPDPKNKVQIEAREVWENKLEMREWCARRAFGNYFMMLDADEIWTGLGEWLKHPAPWGCPRWVNLWHSEKHWIHDHSANLGRRWGFRLEPYGSVCPHYRWSWWRSSYSFLKHHTVADSTDRIVVNVQSNADAATKCPQAVIYHLGHMLPRELMDAKHGFYERRDGADARRVDRRRAWRAWKGETGKIGDGIVSEVTWELPTQVRRALSLTAPVGAK